MTVEITGVYRGANKVELTHGPSGTVLTTVPPVDNQGDGSSFSPTDLVATGLGACMLSLIALVGERSGLPLVGMTVAVRKHMSAAPRRIGKLEVEIHLPAALSADDRTKLERAALTCPVHHSLHPEIEIPVSFLYDR